MESVNEHLGRIEDCLSKMDTMLDSRRTLPFSNSVSVNRQELYDIIDEIRPIMDDIRRDLPNEITHARWFIENNDKMTTEARAKAQSLIKNAESEALKLTDDHEISRLAHEQAAQIVEAAKKDAREMRLNAKEYADELLEKTDEYIRRALDDFMRGAREVEVVFNETLDTVYHNREELRERK